MIRKLGFTKTQSFIGFSTMLGAELVCLYRFHRISKSNDFKGTGEGYFGFTKDVSDQQWNYFEEGIILFLTFQALFLIGSTLVKFFSESKTKYNNLQYYNIVVGLAFSTYLHSSGIIISFVISCLFYLIQKYLQKFKQFVVIMWLLVVGVLYCNEAYDGYRFQWFSLPFLDKVKDEYQLIRWNVIYNLILLRIISFTLDNRWAKNRNRHDALVRNKKTLKDLVKEHQPQDDYNFVSYISYLYYTPLLFAGPTITFNAFNAQLREPQTTYNRADVLKYVLRVYLVDFVTFQVFIHICYPNAINKVAENIHIWREFSPLDLHIMSCFNMVFLWYKFMTIWRMTRAWALLDGIETPENMNRCVYNNYNFSGFWRSWHRSFNQWLIRYIYVPLGGSKFKVLNMWVVFTFVAMWHDFKLDLLLWAWIICLALVPEIAVAQYFNKDKFYNKWWFKYFACFGCACQLEMMTLANMIGFGMGHEAFSILAGKFLSYAGITLILTMIFTRNYGGVVFQLTSRETENQDKNY